jgi:tripeptide aminopeptidase
MISQTTTSMFDSMAISTDLHLEQLLQLFTELTAIQGLSKKERQIADILTHRFEKNGFSVHEDNTAIALEGNAGNLLVFPPQFDSSKPAVVFTAHLDTARSTGGVHVVRHSDRVTSDGTQQLGVDNRAGLSILTYLLEHQTEFEIDQINYFCVFTVAEEIGLLGAYHIDLSAYLIEALYVFDSAMRPGNYISECAGMHLFEVRVHGKAAHSAVSPEKGRSAIKAASEMISTVEFGRLGEFITTNVGLIKGGDATNVIAPECVFEGEVRSLHVSEIQKYLEMYKTQFEQIAVKHAVEMSFSSVKDFNPYQIHENHTLRIRLEKAMIQAGLTPKPNRYTGGSDANVYNEKGLPAINLGIGAQNPHGNDEFMLYEDFSAVLKLAVEILKV